jgi:oligosaccharide repeat unit polymerase
MYTFIMPIPRILFEGKPNSIMPEVLIASTNRLIASTGAAWPNIGEYYHEFGIVGCIIFMCLFGYVCSFLKKLYIQPKWVHSLIAYSIIFPLLIQIVIRGYTAAVFYIVLFLLMPITIIKKLVDKT